MSKKSEKEIGKKLFIFKKTNYKGLKNQEIEKGVVGMRLVYENIIKVSDKL